jgi:hypothetical protein
MALLRKKLTYAGFYLDVLMSFHLPGGIHGSSRIGSAAGYSSDAGKTPTFTCFSKV